ncbi:MULTISPECIES: hypothetical protein [unclassified Streptomyces]|uniref:hypothetical protein n=1 Tax=unclassified Streptomyces TaxID=2593676 RepID=UPI0037F32A10
MTDLLGGFGTELSKNLADKWVSLLALPGALYLMVFAAGRALGHSHALDVPLLIRHITAWAHDPAVTTAGGQVVLLAAVFAASVATGLSARAVGAAIERVALATNWRLWPRSARALARRRTRHRRNRWDEAHREYSIRWKEAARAQALKRPHDPGPRQAALHTRTAISAERPDRPTWSGDRMHAVAVRLRRDHRLDLAQLWPHMWLMLGEEARNEITAARTAIARATELGAWAALYALLAFVWWPAGIVGLLLGTTACRRTRSTTDCYAQLVEAAVRLNIRELAQRLGIDHTEPLSPDAGERFSELLGSAPPIVPDARSESG